MENYLYQNLRTPSSFSFMAMITYQLEMSPAYFRNPLKQESSRIMPKDALSYSSKRTLQVRRSK